MPSPTNRSSTAPQSQVFLFLQAGRSRGKLQDELAPLCSGRAKVQAPVPELTPHPKTTSTETPTQQQQPPPTAQTSRLSF